MTTTQPRPDTGPPGTDADEKATLLAFLDYVREAVAAKAQGLTEQAARTPGVASGTSLLGLVKHLTAAEHYWFVWAFEGTGDAPPDLGMTVRAEERAQDILAGYRAAVRRSNEIAGRCDDLGRAGVRPAGKAGVVRSLRWVLVHMIEETARHAGHADILREQADGAVGR
ncbi:DinB family protein [Streptomyces sp. NPDC001657]|uniref:DinB family protein n=1 Tax=Streptomyces sp. NPDC001657 TaxID=3154522 RepID=UPI00331878A9